MYKNVEVIDLGADTDISAPIKKSPTRDVDEFFEPAAPPKNGEKYGGASVSFAGEHLDSPYRLLLTLFEGQNAGRTLILLPSLQLFDDMWNHPIVYVSFSYFNLLIDSNLITRAITSIGVKEKVSYRCSPSVLVNVVSKLLRRRRQSKLRSTVILVLPHQNQKGKLHTQMNCLTRWRSNG